MSVLNDISQNLQIGKAKIVKELVQQAIDEGIPAKDILEEGLMAGITVVGEKFKNYEMFVPDVLIAAVPVFESVKKKLNAAPVPVVCFSESGDVRPAFYVGADFYMDGVTLARAAAKRLNARARAVKIENERMPMTTLRDEGFRRELMNLLPLLEWTGTVDTSGWNHAETPALLARALKDMEFDTLYVSQGQLPQVMTALGKLKRRDFVQVVGYERPGGRYEGDARLAAVMEQDIRGQGAMCMEAVRQYLTQGIVPDGGRLLIGSRLTAGGEVRK